MKDDWTISWWPAPYPAPPYEYDHKPMTTEWVVQRLRPAYGQCGPEWQLVNWNFATRGNGANNLAPKERYETSRQPRTLEDCLTFLAKNRDATAYPEEFRAFNLLTNEVIPAVIFV